jgi:large subunit ribosomal protein L17
MRHGVKKIKFHNGQDSHQALMRKLVLNFMSHGKIETTLLKGMTLKSTMDRLTGKAIRNSVSDKNMLMKYLTTKEAVKYMIDVVAPAMNKRVGGYVTISKLGKRQGDNAEMTRLTWVEEFQSMVVPVAKKKAAVKGEKVAAPVEEKAEKPAKIASKKVVKEDKAKK